MANTRCENYFRGVWEKTAPQLPLTIIRQDALTVMQAADSVLLASGTATLECALVKRPMVVSYRVSALTAMIVKRLLTVSFFALPNLLLNKVVVPEFIQDELHPETIAHEAKVLLENPDLYRQMKEEFEEIKKKLGSGGASRRAAEAILKSL